MPFNGRDTRRVSRTQSDPDMHPMRRLHSRLKASNAIFAFREPHLKSVSRAASQSDQEPRLNSNQGPVSSAIESRASMAIKGRVSTPLKFASPFDQHDNHVYEGCILSHTKYVSASAISSAVHW